MPKPPRTPAFGNALAPLACALLLAACAGRGQQAAGVGAQTATTPPPDATVATVEGRAIPARLFEMYLRNGREGLGLDERTEEGRRRLQLLREGVVSELIDRELIRREAERRGLSPDAARVAEGEARAVEQLGGEEQFKAYLSAHGLSREEFMETVRAPLYGELLRRELGRDLKATDEELRSFYEAHKAEAEFQVPERAAASHILVAARPSVVERQLREERGLAGDELKKAVGEEMARRRARAEELRLRLFRGGPAGRADFAALAREFSDDAGTRGRGGALGLFQRGSHAKAFDDAAFALGEGEVSAPVQTEFGFHLVKLERREPARRLSFEEAAPDVRRRLLARREAETLKSWLAAARRSARPRRRALPHRRAPPGVPRAVSRPVLRI
ncbi:MAG TPA: peptidylprolyl isomerase [Pyrinomonadaceae bacterium]|jgi:parvulin-like peptidyl-prolyl isomerase